MREFRSALFLDRDGVINERIIDGYVTKLDEFKIIDGVLEAISIFSNCFERVFMVTNQQGIGKGLMSVADLETIHGLFLSQVENAGGHIDRIYFCPALKSEHSFLRKPSIGMAIQAKHDFPEVNLRDSVMVGDTLSDMLFGRRAGMRTVLVGDEPQQAHKSPHLVDFYYKDLITYAQTLSNGLNNLFYQQHF